MPYSERILKDRLSCLVGCSVKQQATSEALESLTVGATDDWKADKESALAAIGHDQPIEAVIQTRNRLCSWKSAAKDENAVRYYLILVVLLLLVAAEKQTRGHEVSPEQRINKLHVRILDADRRVETLVWIAVAAYVVAALVSGAVCVLSEGNSRRSAILWFLAGLMAPVVAMPIVVVRRLKSAS